MINMYDDELMSYEKYTNMFGDALCEWMVEQGLHQSLEFSRLCEEKLEKSYELYLAGDPNHNQ